MKVRGIAGEKERLLNMKMGLEALKKYKSSWVRKIDIEELSDFMQKYLYHIRGLYLGSDNASCLAYRILADKRWSRNKGKSR